MTDVTRRIISGNSVYNGAVSVNIGGRASGQLVTPKINEPPVGNNRNTVLGGLWTIYSSNGAFQTAGQYPIVWSGQSVGLYPNSSGVLEVNSGTSGAYRDLYTRSQRIYDSTFANYLALSHNGTDATVAASAGTMRFQAASGGLYRFLNPAFPSEYLEIDGSGNAVIRHNKVGGRIVISVNGPKVFSNEGSWTLYHDTTGHTSLPSSAMFKISSTSSADGATDIAFGRAGVSIGEINNGTAGNRAALYAGTVRAYDTALNTAYAALSHDGTNAVLTASSGSVKLVPSWLSGVIINDFLTINLGVLRTPTNFSVQTTGGSQFLSVTSDGRLQCTNSITGTTTFGLHALAGGGAELNNGTAGVLRDIYARTFYGVAQAATDIPLVIQGAASQSANLINVTASGGSAGGLLAFTASGRLNIGGTTIDSLGRHLNIVSTAPGIGLYESDVTTDEKGWDMAAAASTFSFRCFNDALNAASNIFTVTRSGYVPNHMKIFPALEVSSYYYTTYTNNGNSGAAKTIDWSASPVQRITLDASCTLTFTAPNGISDVLLHITQNGTGGYSVTWPASVKWAGGTAPTITTTAGAVSVVRLFYDGATYWGDYTLDVR